jgi:endoglycosylceramidase
LIRRLILTTALVLGIAGPAAAAPSLPLDHAGRWLTDARGRVVVLHGVNMVAKRPPYAPDELGFGANDANFLAAEGYNTVRLGVIYAAVEPQPGVYDDAYLDRIEQTVRVLSARGIVTLLDFHQDLYNERFQGEGWPDWAVMDDGLPAIPKLGFPGNYLGMPALSRAFDHFWANDGGLQDRYAAAWAHVAQRFAGNPGVLGYDLLNEPWPGTVYPTCVNPPGCPAFDATLSAFGRRVTTAIRAVDADTLVFHEPHVLFNDGVDTHVDIGDPHAVLSFHDYCLTAGQQGVCDVFDDLVFANAEKHSARTGDALLLTEFGATTDPTVLGPMTDRADRTMVGWQVWHYCACDDPTTSGPGDAQALVRDPALAPAGDNLDTGKLSLLSRPYPRVVAGTPVSWSFSDGVLDATWSTEKAAGEGKRFGAGAISEIAVPARQFPTGYAVALTGARVVSRPGATVLRVAACPTATQISVRVSSSSARVGEPRQSACVAPRLRVSLRPKRVRAGHRVRVRVRVRPAANARILIRGRTQSTGPKGRTVIRRTFLRRGRVVIAALAPGFRPGRAVLRVTGRH